LFSEISRNKHGRFTKFRPYRKGTKMDLRKLKKLIDLVEESGIAEIEVTEGEEKVRITRATAAPAPVYAAPAQVAVPAPAPAAAPAAESKTETPAVADNSAAAPATENKTEAPAAEAKTEVAAADGASAPRDPNFNPQGEYDKLCATCHAVGLMNAPKLGDAAAWKERLDKAGGLDGLVQQGIKGINAMPPKGGSTINDDQFHDTVVFFLDKSGVAH